MSDSPLNGPLLVVVVLTWNDTEMTTRCIESILQSDFRRMRVVLVDNGSREPCGERVKSVFPSIDLVVLPENRGFTGGSNAGLVRALDLGADFVQLVGNDAIMYPDTHRSIVLELGRHPKAAIASPLILNPDTSRTVQFYTSTVDRDAARHVNHSFGDTPVSTREWPTVELDFVPFVAPVFPSWALRVVGLLDEDFGTCWEDYDWCIRARDLGYSILTVGAAHCIHAESQTTGVSSPYIIYYSTRNRLMCLARHGSRSFSVRRVAHVARTFVWTLRRIGLTNWRGLWAFWRGVLDFMRHRTDGVPDAGRLRRSTENTR